MPAEQFLVDFMSPHKLSVRSTPPLGLRPTHFSRDNPAALHLVWHTFVRPPDISTDTKQMPSPLLDVALPTHNKKIKIADLACPSPLGLSQSRPQVFPPTSGIAPRVDLLYQIHAWPDLNTTHHIADCNMKNALPLTPVTVAVPTPTWAPPPPAVVQIAILPMPAEQFPPIDFMEPRILSVGYASPLGLRPTNFSRDNPTALPIDWHAFVRPPDVSTDTKQMHTLPLCVTHKNKNKIADLARPSPLGLPQSRPQVFLPTSGIVPRVDLFYQIHAWPDLNTTHHIADCNMKNALPLTPVNVAVPTPTWAPPPPAVVQIAILPMPAEQFRIDFGTPRILSAGYAPPLGLRLTHFPRDHPTAFHVVWHTFVRPPDVSTDTMDERCRTHLRLRAPPPPEVAFTTSFNYFDSLRLLHFPPPISSFDHTTPQRAPLTNHYADGYASLLTKSLTSLLTHISPHPAPSLCNSRSRLIRASIVNYLACGFDANIAPPTPGPLATVRARSRPTLREPPRWEPPTHASASVHSSLPSSYTPINPRLLAPTPAHVLSGPPDASAHAPGLRAGPRPPIRARAHAGGPHGSARTPACTRIRAHAGGLRSSLGHIQPYHPRPHGPYQVFSKLRTHSYHQSILRPHGPYPVFSKLCIHSSHQLILRPHGPYQVPSKLRIHSYHSPASGGLRSSLAPMHAPPQIVSKLLSPPLHSVCRLLISGGLISSAPTPHIHALYRISCGLRSSFDALYKIPDELSSSALTPHIHAFYQISGGLRSSFDHAHALYQISGGLSSSAPTPHIHALYQISGGLRSSFDHTHLHSEVLVGCSAMLVDTVVHLRAHTPPHPCPCEHPTHRAAPPTALLQPLAMLVSNIVEGHAPDNPGAKTRAPKPPPVKP